MLNILVIWKFCLWAKLNIVDRWNFCILGKIFYFNRQTTNMDFKMFFPLNVVPVFIEIGLNFIENNLLFNSFLLDFWSSELITHPNRHDFLLDNLYIIIFSQDLKLPLSIHNFDCSVKFFANQRFAENSL